MNSNCLMAAFLEEACPGTVNRGSTNLSLVLALLTAVSQAQCVDPPSPSVVICTPSPNATVVYIPEVSARFTPTSGADIRRVVIYDNGRVMSDTGHVPGTARHL